MIITGNDLFSIFRTIKGDPKVYITEDLGLLTLHFHRQHRRHFAKTFSKKWRYFHWSVGIELKFKQINHVDLRRLTQGSQFFFKIGFEIKEEKKE